jgi:nucleoside-diphosphate-sugar epimerase
MNIFLVCGYGPLNNDLVEHMLGEGHNVVAYTQAMGQDHLVGALKNPRFLLMEGDLLDTAHLFRCMMGANAVYYLAVDVDDLRRSVEAMMGVLDCMREQNISRIVFPYDPRLTLEIDAHEVCYSMIQDHVLRYGFQLMEKL